MNDKRFHIFITLTFIGMIVSLSLMTIISIYENGLPIF